MKARRFLLWALLAAVFVAMRLTFNREYEGAPWEALVAGTAKLPFGHRVLVPQLVRPFVAAGVSIKAAFATTEWLACIAALAGIDAALRRFVTQKAATVAAAAFVGVLGLLFLLKFRWPIFYPWDTPAIACMAWGVTLAHGRRHGPLLLLSALGAANRESAVLLPLITVALNLESQHRKEAIRSASLQLIAVVLVRFGVSVLWPISRGGAANLRVEGMWRLDHNLQWLSDPAHALAILGAFSLMPVLWITLRAHIPAALRRLELVVVPVAAGLLVVANIYEPRAWGEPLTLLYVGVAAGLARWMFTEPRAAAPPSLRVMDRWGGLAVSLLAALAVLLWRLTRG